MAKQKKNKYISGNKLSSHTGLVHQSKHKHVQVHLQSYTTEINNQPLFPLLLLCQDHSAKKWQAKTVDCVNSLFMVISVKNKKLSNKLFTNTVLGTK